jgi:hypothetical protein
MAESTIRKTERLTFALPSSERHALEALAREQDRTVAQLVRRGVRLVLAAEQSADREPVAV